MREEERVGDERKVEEKKRRSGELESDCVRKRMVQEGGSGCYPPPPPQMGVIGVQDGKLNKLV